MSEEQAVRTPPRRGLPIVATWTRWAACSAALAAAFLVAVNAYVTVAHGAHADRTLRSLLWLVALVTLAESLVTLAILRAEEARLVRELRTARTATPVIRAMVARRRTPIPILGRLFSTRVGAAAVFLADGERAAALDALATSSPLMQGGRIELLRAVAHADVERAAGTPAGLDRAVRQLRAMTRLDHREADLYRVHVLVKAILEQGDGEAAMDVASELDQASDDEERMYATWLRVWFELDAEDAAAERPFPPLAEGEARFAALVARAQGAARLVDKLEERLLAIAEPGRRE